MKKAVLLSLLLAVSSLFSFAQEIAYDETNDDGIRHLTCEFYLLDYPAIKAISLGCNAYPYGDPTYNLFFAVEKGNKRISAGKKMLIKFSDGSVMEFANPIEIASTKSVVPYNITKAGIEQILSKKISKIRIEHDYGYIDQDIKNKELSKVLKQMYDAIEKALTPVDVYQGF